MADLYVVMHRELGPIATFLTYEEAEDTLEGVFGNAPTWVGQFWVEPFDVVVAEPSTRP